MRKQYLDNIRWMTIVLVVVFHVIYMFNGVAPAGVVGPFKAVQWQDAIQYVLYPWFMVLLFIVAGMCSRYYLQTHSHKEFVASRTVKLLVPSTVGLLVFQWLQGWVNMLLSGAFSTLPEGLPKPVLWLIMSLSGIGVLWFVQLLWIFSLLLVLVRLVERDRLWTLCKKANVVVLVLLGVLFWACSQVLNAPLVSVYRFGMYGFSFFAGYFVFSHDQVVDRLGKWSLLFGAAAGVLAVLYVARYFGQNYAERPAVTSPVALGFAWTAALAILGAMSRWGAWSNPLTSFMAKRGWGLYVFHYLPLSALAYWLHTRTSLTAAPSYALCAVASFAGGLLLNEIISRIPIIRWCVLGIRRKK